MDLENVVGSSETGRDAAVEEKTATDYIMEAAE